MKEDRALGKSHCWSPKDIAISYGPADREEYSFNDSDENTLAGS